jgi:RNA polymerase sigma-70 factor (ECF subfamily)
LHGNEAASEDVLQQTFLKLFTKHSEFDPKLKLRPWLFSIAAHYAVDMKRAEGRRFAHRFSDTAMSSMDKSHDYDPADGACEDAYEVVERGEMIDRIKNLLPSLADEDRRAVNAVYFEQRTFTEAAKHLDIAPGSLKTRIHRSLSFLRVRLDDDGYPLAC